MKSISNYFPSSLNEPFLLCLTEELLARIFSEFQKPLEFFRFASVNHQLKNISERCILHLREMVPAFLDVSSEPIPKLIQLGLRIEQMILSQDPFKIVHSVEIPNARMLEIAYDYQRRGLSPDSLVFDEIKERDGVSPYALVGDYFIHSCSKGSVAIMDLKSRKSRTFPVSSPPEIPREIDAFVAIKGHLLATFCVDNTLKIWELDKIMASEEAPEPLVTEHGPIRRHYIWHYNCLFPNVKNDQDLLVIGYDFWVLIFDFSTKPFRRVVLPEIYCRPVDFSKNHLLLLNSNRGYSIYDRKQFQRVASHIFDDFYPEFARFYDEEKVLLAGGRTIKVCEWKMVEKFNYHCGSQVEALDVQNGNIFPSTSKSVEKMYVLGRSLLMIENDRIRLLRKNDHSQLCFRGAEMQLDQRSETNTRLVSFDFVGCYLLTQVQKGEPLRTILTVYVLPPPKEKIYFDRRDFCS